MILSLGNGFPAAGDNRSDFRLDRNGQGYRDETAYNAIKSVEGVKEMVKSGEIWQVNGGTQEAYIIKAFENVSVILTLSENVRNTGEIPVQSRAQMWTDPRKISFTYNSNFTDFVKKVPEDEAERINTTTRYTLFGVVTDQTKLTDRKTEDVANEEIKRELEGQKEQNSRLDAELDKCRMQIMDLENENAGYRAQIKMLGGMYDKLLNRAIRS